MNKIFTKPFIIALIITTILCFLRTGDARVDLMLHYALGVSGIITFAIPLYTTVLLIGNSKNAN